MSADKLKSIRSLEGKPVSIDASIIATIFFSEQSGFFVAEVRPLHNDFLEKEVTVCGHLAQEPKPGLHYHFEGLVVRHPKYGHQINAKRIAQIMPSTPRDMAKYLASGAIPGIGRKTAKKLVDAFGDQVIDVLDHDPQRILDLPGLSGIRGKMIVDAWHAHRASFEVLAQLAELGLGPTLAMRVWNTFGTKTFEKIRQNPYCLYLEIYGIGFKRADEIALKLGVPPDSPLRQQAAIRFVVDRLTNQVGHTYVDWASVYEQAGAEIGATATQIAAALTEMIEAGQLVKVDDGVGMPAAVFAEEGIAGHLMRLMRAGKKLDPIPEAFIESFIAQYEKDERITLDEAQKDAVRLAARCPVCVISGGPGVGKTTIIRCVLRLLQKAQNLRQSEILLVAPTGRAAKRMQEATGFVGKTIHRAIGMGPDGEASYREDNPLEARLVVVDETSMVDVYVANALVRALAAGTRLIIVGDPDQLPSVGPGTVLADVIDANVVPVARLTKIFRQGAGSAIAQGAHAINHGQMPLCSDNLDDELVFLDAQQYCRPTESAPQASARLIRDFLLPELSKRGFHPLNDVQVLVPMKRGEIGIYALNDMLQKLCNPYAGKRAGVRMDAGLCVYPGDKILVTRNDYQVGLFNGDVGFVQNIHEDDGRVDLVFDEGLFSIPEQVAETLIFPAYAVTIHKSQGSEYPVVIIALSMQNYIMLERQLLFTGVTRGKKKVILIGEKRALETAVKTYRGRQRRTRLAQLLMEKSGSIPAQEKTAV